MLLIVLAGFLLVLGRHLGRPRRRPEGTDLVAQQDLKDEAIRAVRSWVESLPAGAAQLIEEQVPYEYVVRIVPRNTRSLGVQFRIGDNGTFGLYVSAIRIEDLPLSAQYLVEICEAVKQGRVEEEIWVRRGQVAKSKTVLRLPSGNLGGTDLKDLFATILGQHDTRTYEPYC